MGVKGNGIVHLDIDWRATEETYRNNALYCCSYCCTLPDWYFLFVMMIDAKCECKSGRLFLIRLRSSVHYRNTDRWEIRQLRSVPKVCWGHIIINNRWINHKSQAEHMSIFRSYSNVLSTIKGYEGFEWSIHTFKNWRKLHPTNGGSQFWHQLPNFATHKPHRNLSTQTKKVKRRTPPHHRHFFPSMHRCTK